MLHINDKLIPNKYNKTLYANDFKCKNLLPFDGKSFSIGNLNVFCNNGNLYFNGNLTNVEILKTNSAWKNNFSFTLPAGTYTLSTELATSNSVHIAVLKYSDNSTLNQDGGTFELLSETRVYLGFYLFNQTYNNTQIEGQLETGTTPTSYTPYKNFDNTEHVLWTNPSPNAVFDAQDVTLNDPIENYEYYEVLYKIYYNSASGILTTGRLPIQATTIQFSDQYSRGRYVNPRGGTTFGFGSGYYYGSYGNSAITTNNQFIIPYMIIGHNKR